MISDNTIDAINAKYWCAFADKKLLKLLDKAMDHSTKEGKNLTKVAKMAAQSKKTLNEGFWDNMNAMHQAAFPMATGNPYQPNFRAMDPESGVISLQDQQRNNIIAGATSAALVGGSLVPGGWAAITSALLSAGGFVGSIVAPLASVATSIGTAGVMAIVGGIVSVSTYLYPRIAKLLEEVCRTGEIAKCKFEADGQNYIAVFSLSKKRWQLNYADGRWLKSRVNVSKDDILSFFSTNFFKEFLAQCKKYIDSIYSNKQRMECLNTLAKMSDNASKKDMQRLIDAKKDIETYMLTTKFMTEEVA